MKKGFQKGHPQFNSGRTHFKKGVPSWNKGKPNTEEMKKKAVETRMKNNSYVVSEEQKKKTSDSLKGRKRPKFSKEWIQKISEGLRKSQLLIRGKNHHNWKGGSSLLSET